MPDERQTHQAADGEPDRPPEEEAGFVQRQLDAVRESDRKRKVELFVAAAMALATIGAAWASYESSRWGTVQTASFVAANTARVDSTTASTRGGQEVQVDVMLFFQAVNAFASGDEELLEFYELRFRDEFKPAFDAWVAMNPLENPDAALTPFDLPEYQLADFEEADALVVEAEAATAVAATANQRSDNFILAAVVFAAILLFAGISSMFRAEKVRLALVVLATVGFVANSIWIATMPVVLSV